VAESFHPDDLSSLAHRIGVQIAELCPHLPATELAELSSRLAFAEAAHAAGVTFEHGNAEPAAAPAGNHVVWLPGSTTSAIVLPSGEEQSRAAVVKAQALAWARRHGALLHGLAARGSAALRQVGATLMDAYQARPRVQ
jgi:hypothetical protein